MYSSFRLVRLGSDGLTWLGWVRFGIGIEVGVGLGPLSTRQHSDFTGFDWGVDILRLG